MVTHMRATLAIFMVAMCLMPLSFLANEPTSAANITIEVKNFSNGGSNLTIDFPSAGMDNTNGLSVQSGLFVDTATLRLHSMDPAIGDRDYPSNITIDIGGDGLNEWQWKGQGYGPLGMQNTFTNGLKAANASIGASGGNDSSMMIRMPKKAVVRSAVVNVSAGTSIGTPGKILCIYAEYTGYGWQNDPINKLKAFTSDFNTVDGFNGQSGTPTWDQIKDYSGILLWSQWNYGYAFQNGANLGDLMANYVDAGGAVVLADYAMLQSGNYYLGGRFNSGGYYCIQPSGSIYYTSNSGITINQPGHPLFNGFNSINWNYYGYTYVSGSNAASGATSLAKDNYNGWCFAATKTINGVDRVDLNFWPISYNSPNAYWGYGGDGDKLLKNALLFAGRKPVNISVDMFNDGTTDFQNSTFTGNYTLPDFSEQLNSYIASHDVAYTDKWGNQFVDVPINVSSPKMGKIELNNLKVIYDYQTDIDQNPGSGNLTLALGDLLPTEQGTSNISIPIYVTTASAGRFLLDNFYIRLTPPNHAPKALGFFPAAKIDVKENSQLDFGVNATDIYGNPVTYQWYFDEAVVTGVDGDRYSAFFDYEDAGKHTARMDIYNGLKHTIIDWTINVINVDRPPIIEESLPSADTVNMKEGTNQTFSVRASDLDNDLLRYVWTVDNMVLPKEKGNNITFTTDFQSSGDHSVSVSVFDLPYNMSETVNWAVKVENVVLSPLITEWYPTYDPKLTETDSWTFGVTGSDYDNLVLTTTWYLDGAQVLVGNPFTYKTDYKSAGMHAVKAVVSNGQLTSFHEWQVNVVNLNRLPVVMIETPKDMMEFMEGAQIHFSAKPSYDPDAENMSFTWKENGVNISTTMEFDRPFNHGIHTVVLSVADQSGGINETSVRFRVRWTEISLVVGLDRLDVAGNDKVTVIVTMTNVGDTNSSSELMLELLVDGKSVGSKPLSSIGAGAAAKETFIWKAVKGAHTITAKVGDQTWQKPVTVAPPPAAAGGPNIADFALPIMIILVAVVLAAWGMMALRKK